MGGHGPGHARLPRRGVGSAGARRSGPVRVPHARGRAGGALLEHDPAQARGVPPGLCRIRSRLSFRNELGEAAWAWMRTSSADASCVWLFVERQSAQVCWSRGNSFWNEFNCQHQVQPVEPGSSAVQTGQPQNVLRLSSQRSCEMIAVYGHLKLIVRPGDVRDHELRNELARRPRAAGTTSTLSTHVLIWADLPRVGRHRSRNLRGRSPGPTNALR